MRKYSQRAVIPLETRLFAKIDAAGPCWLWTGGTAGGTPGDRYGYIGPGRRGSGPMLRVHRVVWELLVGPIPEGLELDHLCRVRICCNPDHLEPVTHRENLRRGAHGPGIPRKRTR